VSQEVNSPPKNSQAENNPEETKVKIMEEKEEKPAILPTNSEEKKEGDTQKIDIQSTIQAMIEKPETGSTRAETTSEDRVAVKRKRKRRKDFKKEKRLDSQNTLSEKYEEENKESRTTSRSSESDTLSQPKSLEEQKITTKGIAHFKENVIKIAGGFKLHSGDEIKIGERVFELRHLEPSKKPLYWGILALGVIVLFFIFQFGFTGYKDAGKIVGVVLDRSTGALLPHAQVELLDLGKKVQSNDLGFFVLDVIPPGTYEMQSQLQGYSPTTENAVVLKKQISTTIVQLSPEKEITPTSQTGSKELTTKSQTQSGTSKPVATSSSSQGSIKIESNVPDVRVYVDSRYVGTGNKLYTGITSGTHNLRLSKDNYEDWTGRIRVNKGETHNLKVNLDKAVVSSAPNASTKSEANYFSKAQSEYDGGNYAGAVENYTRWLSSNSNDPEVYWGRGNSYLKLGEKSKAIADFSEGAKLFENKDNFSKAVLCYNQILSLNPGDINSLYSRGTDYMRIGEYKKAVPDLKKVTEQNPKFFNGFMELGDACYYSNDYECAIEGYSKAKKLNSNDKQVYVRLALAYTALKDKSGAKKNYEKFKELTTLVDREKMKDNEEWIGVLKFLGENTEKEF
jgi:tetratricopeptide (TPR) repeat protein